MHDEPTQSEEERILQQIGEHLKAALAPFAARVALAQLYPDAYRIGDQIIPADETETIRRQGLLDITLEPGSRAALEAAYGQVWDTSQMTNDFDFLDFMPPLVAVRRRADGRK
jgi:hypothetical protein